MKDSILLYKNYYFFMIHAYIFCSIGKVWGNCTQYLCTLCSKPISYCFLYASGNIILIFYRHIYYFVSHWHLIKYESEWFILIRSCDSNSSCAHSAYPLTSCHVPIPLKHWLAVMCPFYAECQLKTSLMRVLNIL